MAVFFSVELVHIFIRPLQSFQSGDIRRECIRRVYGYRKRGLDKRSEFRAVKVYGRCDGSEEVLEPGGVLFDSVL